MIEKITTRNSFTLMRHIFALTVIYDHAFVLGGYGLEPVMKFLRLPVSLATISVYGFFLISGFLITASYLNSKSTLTYLLKRLSRIMPGFWVCLFVTSIFGLILYLYSEKGNFVSYFLQQGGPLSYIKNNFFLTINQFDISNTTNKLPFPNSINGSLWTLIFEMRAYILIALLGLSGALHKYPKVVLSSIFLFVAFLYSMFVSNPETMKILGLRMSYEELTFQMYFLIGALYYVYRKVIPLDKRLFSASIILVIIGIYLGVAKYVLPLSISYVCFYLCSLETSKLSTLLGKKRDFSYGIYIYAFPIEQTLATLKVNILPLPLFVLSSMLLVMPMAILSWYFIEQPIMVFVRKVLATRS